jgi:hypothetical protein
MLVEKTTTEGLRKLEHLETEINRHWTTVSDHRYRCLHREAALAIDHIATFTAAKMDTWQIFDMKERLYESKQLRVLELKVLRSARMPQWIAPGESYVSFCGQVTVHCSKL